MPRHFRTRKPRNNGRIAWYRGQDALGARLSYRLFRRDCRRGLHMVQLTFLSTDSRRFIASKLRESRQNLRDDVDNIDLKMLGLVS